MDSHVLTTGHVAPSQEGVGRALPGVEVGGDGVVAARAGGLGQVLREAAGVCPVSHGVGCGGGQVGHLGPQQRAAGRSWGKECCPLQEEEECVVVATRCLAGVIDQDYTCRD